jgi:hypothetical protein
MPKDIRIPFIEAMNEPGLLQPWLTQLSLPQLTALKIIYGCPLDNVRKDSRGWTEMDYWAASQNSCDVDDLGYLKSITPLTYKPQEYREAWGVWGIRGGKTDRFAATLVAYEAVCGGHEAWGRKGRPIVCFQIAQDTRMAKYSLHSIKATLESMSFLKTTDPKKSWITNVTADRIELKNGVTISVSPPTVKSIRGYDSPVAVMDEVAVWYQDADSANPDFEIYRQVSSRQAQFPFAKIVGISSPWNRAGLLYARYEAGTNGARIVCPECRVKPAEGECKTCKDMRRPHRNRVILYSTTALSNPIISRDWLEDERNKDPRAFERECLARFQDSLSGFLNADLIENARARGITQRPPESRNFYIAAIDPAFRQDAFGFTIVHADADGKIVQDYVDRWMSDGQTPLNPVDIIPDIAGVLKTYNIKSVFSDQYNLEALQFIANQYGFTIEEVTFSSKSKAEIYGNLRHLLNQGSLSLLDDQETINELKSIEKRLSQAGTVQISAPEGMHDDMATVVAIAAHEAVWLLPKKEAPVVKKPGIVARIQEQVAAKARYIHSRQHEHGYDDF